MRRTISAVILGLVLNVWAGGICPDEPWARVRSVLIQGDARGIADLVGGGKVSLRLDGIPQGRYTAEQASRLFREFFRQTESRKLRLDACGTSGNRLWAEARYEYRWRKGGRVSAERILLELCYEERGTRLCGIRSVSP